MFCDVLVNLPPDHPSLALDPGDAAPYCDEVAVEEEETAEEIAWQRDANAPDPWTFFGYSAERIEAERDAAA